MRHRHRLRADTALAWLFVVVRNEALAVARADRRSPPLDHAELEHRLGAHGDAGEDSCERLDLRDRARRDLPRLEPQERRALVLQASGLSYREIGELTGWSYTKVNRCLSEGRAALRRMHGEASLFGADASPRSGAGKRGLDMPDRTPSPRRPGRIPPPLDPLELAVLRHLERAVTCPERELRFQLDSKDRHPLARSPELLDRLADLEARGLLVSELRFSLTGAGRAALGGP